MVFTLPATTVQGVSFTADNRRLAVADREGGLHVATLANDVYVECGGSDELEFMASNVPSGLAVGGQPTTYTPSFAWVTRELIAVAKKP